MVCYAETVGNTASGSVLLIGTLGGGGAGAPFPRTRRQAGVRRTTSASCFPKTVVCATIHTTLTATGARTSGLEPGLRYGIQQLQHGGVLGAQAPKPGPEHREVP